MNNKFLFEKYMKINLSPVFPSNQKYNEDLPIESAFKINFSSVNSKNNIIPYIDSIAQESLCFRSKS